MTLSSPQFSVWSRHTRNSTKKPGRPKKEQAAVATSSQSQEPLLPLLSSSFDGDERKRRAETNAQSNKKRRVSSEVGSVKIEEVSDSSILQQGVVMIDTQNALMQYTNQFYQIMSLLSDKDKMGAEERRVAFKLAYQHLCHQQQL